VGFPKIALTLSLLVFLVVGGFSPAQAANCTTFKPKANLAMCDLSGVEIWGKDLTEANLSGATFARASLANVNLTRANLSGTNFSGASLASVSFEKAIMVGSDFSGALMTDNTIFAPGAKILDVTLSNVSLEDVVLNGIKFINVDLTGATFKNVNLTSSLFGESVLDGVTFSGGTLRSARIYNSQAENLHLDNVDVSNADFSFTNLTGSKWTNVYSDGGTKMNQTELAGADLSGFPAAFADGEPKSLPSDWGFDGNFFKKLTKTPFPSISGISKVGKTLIAIPGKWDTDVNFTYVWLRDGVAINAATTSSYVLQGEDFGRVINVVVGGHLSGYRSVGKKSAPVKVEAGLMATSTPKIAGTAKSGSTLKVTSAAWVKGAKITYQWLSNGAVIKSATSSSLKISSTLKGKKISVKVTQSATGYTTATKTSNTLTVSK
jgi:uncharacterized protein YjbI with pentapeptide repeats